MLKRKINKKLLDWKNSKHKLALLIGGARQVGKTFAIRQFGKANYKNYIEINFEQQPSLKSLFDGDLDAKTIIQKLSTAGLGSFEKGNTLIFFDEIQSCPNARTAIKFLVEDGQYDYIESGSLLGLGFKDVSSYPVGYEEHINMYPLDFEEFLWAKNIPSTVIDSLYEAYKTKTPVDDFIHNRIFKAYFEYLVVGGMPSVVNTFIHNSDFNQTLKMQNNILKSYRDDISKYVGKSKILVKNMFDAICQQLAKPNKRFILADLEKGASARKYENSTLWLTEAGLAYNCFNVTALENNLGFYEKRNLYKLYMHDTGLLCALGLKRIQFDLLNGNLSINEGGITENAVAAMLAKNNIPLYYFDKQSRMELDFLISKPYGLMVVEVKSGKDYKRHTSLNNACQLEGNKIKTKIVLCKSNIEKGENDVLYLPLYMAMFITNELTTDD